MIFSSRHRPFAYSPHEAREIAAAAFAEFSRRFLLRPTIAADARLLRHLYFISRDAEMPLATGRWRLTMGAEHASRLSTFAPQSTQ